MTNIHATSLSNSVDGLPKQFVTSLRVLFDILDEDRTGYVRLRDIESRWHEEGVTGLPSGVIDTLRKVAPKNGCLSFDNFVTGLKLSLLKPNGSGGTVASVGMARHPARESVPVSSTTAANMTSAGSTNNKASRTRTKDVNAGPNKKSEHSSSNYANMANYMNVERASSAAVTHKSQSYQAKPNPSKSGNQVTSNINTATVRPNNILQSQNIELRNQIYNRDQMQQASVQQKLKSDFVQKTEMERTHDNRTHRHKTRPSSDDMMLMHARKAEQSKTSQSYSQNQRPKSAFIDNHNQRGRGESAYNARLSDIPAGRPERPPPYRAPGANTPPALPPKNMQGRIMQELKSWQTEHKQHESRPGLPTAHSDSKLMEKNRMAGNDLYVNIDEIRRHAADQKKTTVPGKKPARRNNSRRHTLSSGIDYNVIRRMKQLEGEKDVLLQGLPVVERSREWYIKQVAMVTEKQNYAEKTSCSDATLQKQQERIDYLYSRINDANFNLKSLMQTTESGFPAHMNLAIRRSAFPEDKASHWLKEQNKQLTKEVGQKSDKITQLEQEKASLIRELFETRSKHKSNYDDTTFM